MNDFYAGALAEGFARPCARQTPDTFDVVGGPLAIVVDDDPERAADLVRPTLALYIGGMGARGVNFRYEVFARMGYEGTAGQNRARTPSATSSGLRSIIASPSRRSK
jgi:hypothetical protein